MFARPHPARRTARSSLVVMATLVLAATLAVGTGSQAQGGEPAAALSLAVERSTAPWLRQPVAYSIQVANAGPGVVVQPTLAGKVSGKARLVRASGAGASCTIQAKAFECAVADLAPGAGLAVSVTVRPRALGRLKLTVRAEATGATSAAAATASRVKLQPFRITRARARPSKAFFAARRVPTLRYRLRSPAPAATEVEVVRRGGGRVVARWVKRKALPGRRHVRPWNGLDRRGRYAGDGRYRFRVRQLGARRWSAAKRFTLHGNVFPVRGGHGTRGSIGTYGAPRSGGRRHEGFDITAPCGRKLVAARGGRIQTSRFDPVLRGHYVVIDARKSRTDYMYAHLARPSPVAQGRKVWTGQTIGRIGRTGNAASTPCHLHFEVWPHGYRNRRPVDPAPLLRAWDSWS